MIASISIGSATNYTTPTEVATFQHLPSYRQGVAIFTVGFSGINSRNTGATQKIYSLRYELKMLRIAARFVITNMIYNRYALSVLSSRQWFNKHGIGKSMRTICIALMPKKAIAKLIFGMSPIPAAGLLIDFDFGIEPLSICFADYRFKYAHIINCS